jgi:hypothetical protein
LSGKNFAEQFLQVTCFFGVLSEYQFFGGFIMAEKKGNCRDAKAPAALTILIVGPNGQEWGRLPALGKEFSTGSVGFNATGKISNPDNPEAKYQVGVNITLVGSKPAS